jgi:uncharacterized membrane-anchored protein
VPEEVVLLLLLLLLWLESSGAATAAVASEEEVVLSLLLAVASLSKALQAGPVPPVQLLRRARRSTALKPPWAKAAAAPSSLSAPGR